MCNYLKIVGFMLVVVGVLGDKYRIIKVPRDSHLKVKAISKRNGEGSEDIYSPRYFFDASIIQTLLDLKNAMSTTTTTSAPPTLSGFFSGALTSPGGTTGTAAAGGISGLVTGATGGTVTAGQTGSGTGGGTAIGTGVARFPMFRSVKVNKESRKSKIPRKEQRRRYRRINRNGGQQEHN